MSVVLSEHLPLLATAPDGIQKLRGLILELAVRGKLVPQDPKDESSNEILEDIRANKAKLIAEGVVKEKKPLPDIADKERLFQLPARWEWARLDEIASKITDGEHISPQKTQSGMKLLTAKHVLDQGITFDDPQYVSIEDGVRFRGRCDPQTGDILICSRGTIGRCCAIEVTDEFCLMGSVILVRAFPQIAPRYLDYYLKSGAGQFFIRGATKGMAVNALYLKDIRLCPVAVPPSIEQHRIVAKVDELMALCDRLEAKQADAEAAHAKLVETLLCTLTQSTDAADLAANWQRITEHFDTLFTTESSLDALKQTILQLAVMGKLVPQDPKDEPASELVKRIAQERTRLEAAGKIRKSKPLPPVNADEQPYTLPENWSWSRLGQLVIESGAGWSPSCESRPRENDEWGVLKVSSVSWGTFNPAENKALPPNLEPRSEHEVVAGDFLVSRANTADLVARSVVVKDCPRHLMLSDKIVRLKLSKSVSGQFVNLANSCFHARNYYAAVAGGTSASMKNVSREQILNLAMPLPPLAEQHRIVAKVDELMALCDRLKADLAQSRAHQDRLASTLIESALQTA